MTLTIDFFLFLDWNWQNWTFFILIILSSLFLILGSNDLKKSNFASTKLLFIIGIVLLIWEILQRLFIPFVYISSPSPPLSEVIIVYVYTLFLRFGIIYSTFGIVLGIGFIKFGSNNRDRGGTVMLVGGIVYLLMVIINLILNTLSLSAVFLPIPGVIFYILTWITILVIATAVILIFISTIFTKRALFIVYGALLLAVYFMQFLFFIGII